MLQIRAKILYNKKVKGSYFHLVLRAQRIAGESSPGQFLNIKVNDGNQPLLRRPFSIHNVKGTDIDILYEVVGRGSEILSQKIPGGCLDVIGPLGNGFDYLSPVTSHQSPVLVAGGMGVAPLLFLADKIVTSHKSQVTSTPLLLIGAKTKEQIICEKDFQQLGCDIKIATDDGSRGFKGYVSDLLKHELSAKRYPLNAIYACGPKAMLKEIAFMSRKYAIPAQVSLEEHMACGIGACLGCVVNTKYGFKRVCKEGPVFDGNEIIW